MVIIDKIRRKIVRIFDKILSPIRRKYINNKDFSIISNNCWAGFVYKRYQLPYLTPTVGFYFYAEDYIKFCYNLKYYISLPLKFIEVWESKHADSLTAKGQTNIPIARLDDIEIIFLHYTTKEEAFEKWERRKQRINYENLIFKFSEMNDCTYEHLKKFEELEVNKKICFTTKNYQDIKSSILFRSYKNENQVKNDTNDYSRYLNIEKLINAKKIKGKKVIRD